MGGSSSKATTEKVVKTISEQIYNLTQECSSSVSGLNEVDITGNYNVIDHVSQTVKVNFTADCVNNIINRDDFADNLSDNVAQSLKSDGVALTEFADAGSQSSVDNVKQIIKHTVTANVVQKCLMSIVASNTIRIAGSGNRVEDIQQNSTVAAISNCLSGNHSVIKAANKVSDITSQESKATSANPIAPLTDLIGNLSTNMVLMIGAIILAILTAFMLLVGV